MSHLANRDRDKQTLVFVFEKKFQNIPLHARLHHSRFAIHPVAPSGTKDQPDFLKEKNTEHALFPDPVWQPSKARHDRRRASWAWKVMENFDNMAA
ncbi:MAG: hypothetical protein HQL86_03775 [Magnetococcales bacterium]|nr:hypothetical protein [Magnetococcales bacterium]